MRRFHLVIHARRPSALVPAVLLVLGFASSVGAVCNQKSASTAETDLWNTHQCWQDFFLYSYKAYDQRSSDWAGRGWDDACNVNLEFPKHWNAAYLLTYGLVDENCCSFHGTEDYMSTALSYSSQFHDALYHSIRDTTSLFGAFNPTSSGPNELDTDCPLYDTNWSNANPASRAGDFMHEGWHAWLLKYNWNNGSCGGHRCSPRDPNGNPLPLGACTAVDACDYFYFHGIGDYAFGAMYQTDGTAKRFHSPNQVQVEFLCDVADYPQSWVPKSVREAARTDADKRAAERFINGPGYKCGDARPW